MSADKPIPDVILRAAADFCRARGVSPMDTPFHPTPAVLAVIDAIMARDERAAKIVETLYLFPEPTSRAARYHLKHCVRPIFAAAIRNRA